MSAPLGTPLPLWDVRLARFLGSDHGPWPLHWCVGKHGMCCVCCGITIDHDAAVAGRGDKVAPATGWRPACTRCKLAVDKVLATFPPNDWSKRYRKVLTIRERADTSEDVGGRP